MKRLGILLVVVASAYAATSIYFVGPSELAIVRRCGRALPTPRGPGAHLGLPWGWEQRDLIRPSETKQITLGLVQAAQSPAGASVPQFLTGDRNLINLKATVQFSVEDPQLYLFHSDGLPQILRDRGLAAFAQQLCGIPVDSVLTRGKLRVAAAVRDELQAAVNGYQLGITIRSVDLATVAAPPEVAEAFDDVIMAQREKQQLTNQASSYSRGLLASTAAEAQQTRDEASGYYDRTLRQAEADAAVFLGMLGEYRRSPKLTAQRLYYETLAKTLPQLRTKIVVASDGELDLSILRKEKDQGAESP